MVKQKKNNQTSFLRQLLGEPTSAKSSGLVFSLVAVIPVLLSFLFLLMIAVLAPEEGYQQKDWFLYASFLLPQIAFVLVAVCYFFYTKTPLRQRVIEQKCRWGYFIIAILLQVGLFALSQLNGWFLQWLEKFGYVDQGVSLPSMEGWGFVGVFLVIAVFAPVLEEMVFRGLLLHGLKDNFSTLTATLVCGALFALYHQNPAQTLYQFCCGFVFAYVAIQAGSVLPTILAHFLNNAVILILTKYGVTQFNATVNITIYALSAVSSIAAIVWLLKIKNKTKTGEKDKKNAKSFFLYAAVGIFICTLTWLSVLLTGL